MKEDSPLHKHNVEYHPNKRGGAEYYMEVDREFQKPMQRQLREMIVIEMYQGDILLNSKNEYQSARVPRVVLEGVDVNKQREKGRRERVMEEEVEDKTGQEVIMEEDRIVDLARKKEDKKGGNKAEKGGLLLLLLTLHSKC